MCIQQTKLISKFTPPISHTHTHTSAIPVRDEVEQQAEYNIYYV